MIPRLLGALLIPAFASPAAAQSLGDLVTKAAAPDTSVKVVTARWQTKAGEFAAGTLLAAAAGYGVGLLAENTFCKDCDAGSPGGDTPGIVFGVPLGAVAGVFLVGRMEPPAGSLMDTFLGAAIGTAVFAGYVELLDGKGDLVRWAGVVFPAGMATMGFNKSREAMLVPPPAVSGRVGGSPGMDLTLLRMTFD
jgi:hypothetical protein